MWKKKEKLFMVSRTIKLVKQIELAYDTETISTLNGTYSKSIYTGEKKEKFYVEVKKNWSDGSESTDCGALIAKDEKSANLIFDMFVKNKGVLLAPIVIKTTKVQAEK